MSELSKLEDQQVVIDGELYVQCRCGDVYPAKSYGAGFIVANWGVCENCDDADESLPWPQVRNMIGELYQVLGALDAGAKVLDQVSAAIHGQPLPHETLLPFVGHLPATTPPAHHDQAALDVSTQIMALVRGPELLGGDTQLKAKIQCLLVDLLGSHAARPSASIEEHELLGYIEPPVLLDLLQGSDTSTKIRSAAPSLTNPDPGPRESWAVPIFVVRRKGGPQ